MRFTIARGGDYAEQIASTAPGARVLIEGPYGAFTAARADAGRRVLLIGGGVGITPIRTLLDDLPTQSRPVVLYRVRNQGEVLFRTELEALVASRGGSLHVLVGGRTEQPVDAALLRDLAPDLQDRAVFVCGGGDLVAAARKAAVACGVPAERVHSEEFAW
jgi:ferredoxin-NADP reductase